MTKDSKRRRFQTEVYRLIKSKNTDYAQCAKRHNIFNKLNLKRLNLDLFISLDKQGRISKFKLDEKNYPESFVNCFFKVTELISFPKNPENQMLEITQPFTFSDKR